MSRERVTDEDLQHEVRKLSDERLNELCKNTSDKRLIRAAGIAIARREFTRKSAGGFDADSLDELVMAQNILADDRFQFTKTERARIEPKLRKAIQARTSSGGKDTTVGLTKDEQRHLLEGTPEQKLAALNKATASDDSDPLSPLAVDLMKTSEPVSFPRPEATFGETPGAGTVTRDNVRDNFRASDYKPDEQDVANMTPEERAKIRGFDNFGLAAAGFDKPVPGLTKPQPGLPADSPLGRFLSPDQGMEGFQHENSGETLRGKSLVARFLKVGARRDDSGKFSEADAQSKQSDALDASVQAQSGSVEAERLNSRSAHRRASDLHSSAAELHGRAGNEGTAEHHRERAAAHRTKAEELQFSRER